MDDAALEMAVAAVIVNYGTAERVIDALPALLEELARFRRGLVLIVDNASPGEEGQRLAAHLEAAGLAERTSLIRSPRNGGFAAGNNLAF